MHITSFNLYISRTFTSKGGSIALELRKRSACQLILCHIRYMLSLQIVEFYNKHLRLTLILLTWSMFLEAVSSSKKHAVRSISWEELLTIVNFSNNNYLRYLSNSNYFLITYWCWFNHNKAAEICHIQTYV